MAGTKKIFKSIVLFLAGFIAGSVLVRGFLVWNYSRLFVHSYYTSIANSAYVVTMIRANRQEELIKNTEESMVRGVEMTDKHFRNYPDRLWAFWWVQSYYEKFKLPVPETIKPILDKLPKRPLTSCELKQIREPNKIENAEQNDVH
jgi:hypothetical protein